jgi:DNA-binding NarL/FixJ family response regulator
VLRLLAQGCRNKEIARDLGVSIGTVKTHLRHIFRKLKVYDRTTAVLTVLQSRHLEAA